MVCHACHVDPPAFDWHPVSGAGRLATWTIVREAFLPGFAAITPYVVGEVELVEQKALRIVARVVDVEHADLRIGLELQVGFVDGGEGTHIPVFRRAWS